MTSTVDFPARAPRHTGKLLGGLIALGWVYALAQVLTLETPGSLAQAGPGMVIFAYAKAHLFGDPFALQSSFSFCVTNTGAWGVSDFLKAMAMWLGMVLAMMLPVLLSRGQPTTGQHGPAGIAGYIAAWLPFCAMAVAAQWGLQTLGLLNAHALVQDDRLAIAILLGVAAIYVYRFAFSAPRTDRDLGALTTFHAGLSSGWRCLLCCGPVMSVMFIIGLMNIVGMLAMTVLMVVFMAARSREVSLLLGVGAVSWAALIAMA